MNDWRTRRLGLEVLLAGVFMLAPVGIVLGQTTPVQTPATQAPPTEPTESTKVDAALPGYDVSVIRPSASEGGDQHVWTRLNTLEVRNIALLDLLASALDVPKNMIVGLPEWARHTRLDIDAKTLEPDMARLRELTFAQRWVMLQALLESRLGLQWHRETRVLPSYELLVGNGGAALKPTAAKGDHNGISVNDTRFRLTNVPVSDLAVVLSDKVGRPVVDKTGLTGRYDVTLVWSSDGAVLSADPDAPPPLFTAVKEQLGLKLESGKDPVQVFVIDRLTPPGVN